MNTFGGPRYVVQRRIRILSGALLSAALILVAVAPARTQSGGNLNISIYSGRFALVRQDVQLSLRKGVSENFFAPVPVGIDLASVRLIPLHKPDAYRVLEVSLDRKTFGWERLLENFRNKSVRFYASGSDTLEGRLLGTDPFLFELPDGRIRAVQSKDLRWLDFPGPAGKPRFSPRLRFVIDAKSGGVAPFWLEYLTEGLAWSAEYRAVLDPDRPEMALSASVILENSTRLAYRDARLELVAGKLNLVRRTRPVRYERTAMAKVAAVPQEIERSVFEYHIYPLPGRISLEPKAQKRVELFARRGVPVRRKYIADGSRWPSEVRVFLAFRNSRKSRLGFALPGGRVRFFEQRPGRNALFIGEDVMPPTPENEKVELFTGVAFDVKVSHRRIDTRRPGKRSLQETWEVKLRNQKQSTVQVILWEHFTYRAPEATWRIVESTHALKKTDAQTAEALVTVPAGKEEIVRYTVQYTW